MFKHFPFSDKTTLVCVCRYCKKRMFYRDLVETRQERGLGDRCVHDPALRSIVTRLNWRGASMKTSYAFMTMAAAILCAVAQAQAPTNPIPPAATSPVSAAPAAVAKPAPSPRTPESAQTPEIKSPDRHKDFLFRITQGDVGLLFMGDSITDFWPSRGQYSWLKFAPYNPADFGISADRTEHVLWRIDNGELDGIHPKVMVLMIGTNNDGVDQPEWIASAIEKIIAVTHDKLPTTKVLLLGIFPRGKHGNRATVVNHQVNDILSKLDNGKTVRYLDVGKAFLDANGDVPPEIMPDGLHPNAHGYDLWYAAMKPLLDQMMK